MELDKTFFSSCLFMLNGDYANIYLMTSSISFSGVDLNLTCFLTASKIIKNMGIV